jgi:hypothetical protein
MPSHPSLFAIVCVCVSVSVSGGRRAPKCRKRHGVSQTGEKEQSGLDARHTDIASCLSVGERGSGRAASHLPPQSNATTVFRISLTHTGHVVRRFAQA